MAQRVLKEGSADLIAAGRAVLCDPYWPRKAMQGEVDRIRPCVACNYCIWKLFQQEDLTCFQNALLGNEYKYRMDPAEKVKKSWSSAEGQPACKLLGWPGSGGTE